MSIILLCLSCSPRNVAAPIIPSVVAVAAIRLRRDISLSATLVIVAYYKNPFIMIAASCIVNPTTVFCQGLAGFIKTVIMKIYTKTIWLR